ncbi:MAG: aa3-type cytochrome c oxidase subunit IV [Neomegalonema sp.]|nr:aa3-type cytochrome c oxidase subunit IV [Neomegalonema sp.]
MADYEIGKMDVTEHRKMYDTFWSFLLKISIFLAILLTLMAFFTT